MEILAKNMFELLKIKYANLLPSIGKLVVFDFDDTLVDTSKPTQFNVVSPYKGVEHTVTFYEGINPMLKLAKKAKEMGFKTVVITAREPGTEWSVRKNLDYVVSKLESQPNCINISYGYIDHVFACPHEHIGRIRTKLSLRPNEMTEQEQRVYSEFKAVMRRNLEWIPFDHLNAYIGVESIFDVNTINRIKYITQYVYSYNNPHKIFNKKNMVVLTLGDQPMDIQYATYNGVLVPKKGDRKYGMFYSSDYLNGTLIDETFGLDLI